MTAFLTAATAILGAPFVAGLCFIGACAVGYVSRIDAIARRRKNPYMVASLDRASLFPLAEDAETYAEGEL